MEIQIQEDKKSVVIFLEGSLDSITAPEVEKEFRLFTTDLYGLQWPPFHLHGIERRQGSRCPSSAQRRQRVCSFHFGFNRTDAYV